MNIKDVVNAARVATIEGSWENIRYHDGISNKILRSDIGRVYIITCNDIIMKIGGSACQGGIKSTIGSYKNATTGNPSLRSFGIYTLIDIELKANNRIDIYMIISPVANAIVNGLFTSSTVEIYAFKEMESLCLSEYKSVEGKYPPWNFQENNEKWPDFIREKYNYLNKGSIND